MSERKKAEPPLQQAPGADARSATRRYCRMHPRKQRIFPPGVIPRREALINLLGNKWVNGTVLHYYFFDKETDGEVVRYTDGTSEFVTWKGAETQKQAVRDAFNKWRDAGIGVSFEEISDASEAEVRIGFMKGDGSWSWLGRDILNHSSPTERTMNIGWDIANDIDTAIHEIGHTLGFPHEHQNPKAGIEWNEEAVYAKLAEEPNEWDRETTFWNIIRKLPANEVEGTTWDPNSIMHYPFEKGLIKKPVAFANGLTPKGGLSEKDIQWAIGLYPKEHAPKAQLVPAQSVPLRLAPGEQLNLNVEPADTRQYTFRTFGASDTVMVLFEDQGGTLRYVTADDDSGEDRNAEFRTKLFKGKRYVLRVRLYYSDRPGETAVMMW